MNRREACTLLTTASALAALSAAEGAEKPEDQAAGDAARPRLKVLMPVGDATEAVDTLYPFFRLQENDHGRQVRLGCYAVRRRIPRSTVRHRRQPDQLRHVA